MPSLTRDGIALHYERSEGRAPPVLLAHGWCCDLSFLAPQAEHFARRGHTVVSIDFRGHGRSDKPDQPYPIAGFADDLAWTCARLGLVRPVVIGHSMGGIVAYDLAARHPDLPAAIAMIDAATVLPAPALAALPAELDRLRAPDFGHELARLMDAVFFLPTDDPARRARILATMAATPQHVVVAAYEGLAAYVPPAGVVVPSLYIAADEPSPRSDMTRLRALLPGLAFGQTVGSGHFCQLEVPAQVNAMLDRFLALAVPGFAA